MKNFINKTLIVLIFSLIGFAASAQTMKQRVADRLYDELALFKAVEMYEDLAKKDDASIYILRRTAECYRLLGKYKSSAKWYGKLVEKGGDAVSTDKSDNASNSSSMIPDDYYQYAQMLKMDEKYDLANKMMAKFKSFASDNSVASAHANMPDYVSKIKAMPERYAIAIMNKKVNTEHSDFAPNYWTVDGITKLTFASAKKNMAMLNKDFQWDGSHFLDVYETQLGGDGESTEVKRFDRGIKSKYHEGPVSFSNNGSKMYLTRSNYLNKKKGLDSARHNNLKLYLSEKDSNGEWTELKEFPYNSDDYSLGHATLTEDGKTMYFSSDMPGGKGITDIWKSTNEGGSWSKPVNVAEVNTEGREMFPYLGKTGILYLSSDGQAGLGGLDLYRATASGETFSKPENMGFPLNTNHDDFAMIVNAEETEGYFSSNRDGDDTFGDDDIYRVKIKEPFGPQLFIVRGCALDAESGAKLAGTTVKLIDTKTDQVFESIVTTEAGCYEFKDVPEGCYKIDGTNLTIEKIYEIADADAGKIYVSLSNQSRERVLASRAYVDDIVEKGEPVYGINTGFGALSNMHIDIDYRCELSTLYLNHSRAYSVYLQLVRKYRHCLLSLLL